MYGPATVLTVLVEAVPGLVTDLVVGVAVGIAVVVGYLFLLGRDDSEDSPDDEREGA